MLWITVVTDWRNNNPSIRNNCTIVLLSLSSPTLIHQTHTHLASLAPTVLSWKLPTMTECSMKGFLSAFPMSHTGGTTPLAYEMQVATQYWARGAGCTAPSSYPVLISYREVKNACRNCRIPEIIVGQSNGGIGDVVGICDQSWMG